MSLTTVARPERLKAYRLYGDQPGQTNISDTLDKLVGVLQKAVEERMTLRVSYPPGTREVEPYALGVSRDGNLLLRAWQVRGASAEGESVNAWKLFRLDRMQPILSVGPHFDGPRPGFKRGDRAMTRIIAEL